MNCKECGRARALTESLSVDGICDDCTIKKYVSLSPQLNRNDNKN